MAERVAGVVGLGAPSLGVAFGELLGEERRGGVDERLPGVPRRTWPGLVAEGLAVVAGGGGEVAGFATAGAAPAVAVWLFRRRTERWRTPAAACISAPNARPPRSLWWASAASEHAFAIAAVVAP